MCPSSCELQVYRAAPSQALEGERGLPGGSLNFGKHRLPAPHRPPCQVVVIRGAGKVPVANWGLGGGGGSLCRVTLKKQGGRFPVGFGPWCPGQAGHGAPQKTPPKSDNGNQSVEFRPIGFPAKSGWLLIRGCGGKAVARGSPPSWGARGTLAERGLE